MAYNNDGPKGTPNYEKKIKAFKLRKRTTKDGKPFYSGVTHMGSVNIEFWPCEYKKNDGTVDKFLQGYYIPVEYPKAQTTAAPAAKAAPAVEDDI